MRVAGTIAPTTEAALLEHHRLQQGVPSRDQRDAMENTAPVWPGSRRHVTYANFKGSGLALAACFRRCFRVWARDTIRQVAGLFRPQNYTGLSLNL